MRWAGFRLRNLSAILFGLLAALSFAPIGFWPAAFVALAGWFWLLVQRGLFNRILISYLFGVSLLLPTQSWTGIYVGNIPWLILCFGQGFLFIIPAFLVHKKQRFNQLAFALSLVVVELLLRTVPFTGFGWSRLGFTQIDSPLSSLYPLGGVVLVTFYIALLSSSRSVLPIAALVALPLVASFISQPVSIGRPVKIALVQGGVVDLGLDFNSKPQEVFKRHIKESVESISPNEVELIIWPENSVDVDIYTNLEVSTSIRKFSNEVATPLLIGAVTQSGSGPQNQAILMAPDIKQIYTKRYLTPFGEYLPVRAISENISDYAKQINDFIPGTSGVIFSIKDVQFQTLICYELINDSFVKEITSDFLVIQTNNATFGDTAQLEQQLNIARVRAAQTSRYISYVSTTGITSFIDHKGRVISKAEKFTSQTLFGEIKKVSGETYAQQYARYLELIAILCLLVIVVVRRRRRV